MRNIIIYLCQDPVSPSCPDFGSAPRAHADREHRWRHVEHLLFDCPGISGLGGSLAVNLLRDDLFRACSGSDHATAVFFATQSFRSYLCCGCHGLPCPVPPRPCCFTGTSTPLAHEVAMSSSCRGILAWCVVCGVHPAASVRIRVGKPTPCCPVVRPLAGAPPAVRFRTCPGAAPCACSCSCFPHVRPGIQVRYDRCPPADSGMMSDAFSFF